MNYQLLKNLLDSLVLNFKCPECFAEVKDNNIEVVWAAWNSINLDILCQKCQKHTFIKAEANQLNIWNIMNLKWLSKEEIAKKIMWNIKKETPKNEIKENQILELRDIFKTKNINVTDFLWKN